MHQVRVPFLKDLLSDEWEYRDVAMYYPHEIMEYLFERAGLEIPDAVLANYWRNYRALGVPGSNVGDGINRMPLKFFGDDAQYNLQGDKLLGFILSLPLWRPKQARNSGFVVCVIPLKHSLGYETFHPVLSKIVWSLNKLFDEGLPNSNMRFQVHEVSGDWKYLREVFNMSTHWNSSRVCHFCSLSRSRIPELPDPLPVRTTARFIQQVVNQPTSPLILLRGFQVGLLQWCLLHNLHLGLLWTANGGAMALLLELGVFQQGPAMSVARQLQVAYSMFKLWLKEVRAQSSQRCFTPRMIFKPRHGAYMSSKGWNSRLISAWLADPSPEMLLTAHALPRSLNQ